MTGKIYNAANGWEYWYDYTTKCWFCARFDSEGNQDGDAMDAYTKREIIEIVNIEIAEAS